MDLATSQIVSKRRASIEASSAILAMNLQMKVSGNKSPFVTSKSNLKQRPVRKRTSVSLYDASPKIRKESSNSSSLINSTSTKTPKQADPKCTCYNPPICPVHNSPSKSLITPYFSFPNSHLAMTIDNFTICGPSQTSTTVSLPAIFKGHLLIPQEFASSLEQTIAAQKPIDNDNMHCKGSCGEKRSSTQMECSCKNKDLESNSMEHPEEPHPPTLNTATLRDNVEPELKVSKRNSSPCALSSSWLPIGKPAKRWVYFNNDEKPLRRQCYNAIKHKTETDYIQLRDCVIVNSENSKKVFIGKIAEFFEDPKSKLLWASVVWYYWPEQTELDNDLEWHPKEIFASRHLDIIPVDSIQDLVFVVTLNEYNRYNAENLYDQLWPHRTAMVPKATGSYYRRRFMPSEDADENIVFFCRNIYDFHRKRLIAESN